MPRIARLVLPGLPFHVTQRGVDRRSIFVDDEDRQNYCRLLLQATTEHGATLHAYALMPNHVHLLLTPGDGQALARSMKRCGQLHVQAFNRRHARTGALMQGRFFSSAIGGDRHFLEVLRYIELNPVRAGLVRAAEDFPWSSVHAHLARRLDPLVQPHPTYLALGETAAARADTYRDWLAAGIDADRLAAIRVHLRQGRVFGSEEVQQRIARQTGRPTAVRARGRPVQRTKEAACTPEEVQAVRKSLLTGTVPF